MAFSPSIAAWKGKNRESYEKGNQLKANETYIKSASTDSATEILGSIIVGNNGLVELKQANQ
jgi:hypothetical protein